MHGMYVRQYGTYVPRPGIGGKTPPPSVLRKKKDNHLSTLSRTGYPGGVRECHTYIPRHEQIGPAPPILVDREEQYVYNKHIQTIREGEDAHPQMSVL